MKSVCLMIVVYLFAIPSDVLAQCSGTVQTLTYDTTIRAAGGSTHSLSFPKFHLAGGTLIEVQFRSEVTVSYGFIAQNLTATTYPGYRVWVSRNDELTSSALLEPVMFAFPMKSYGPFTLTANDAIPGSGTDFHQEPAGYAMDHSVRQQNISNTGDYLGLGNVEFDYTANSLTSVPSSAVGKIDLDDTSADTLNFRVTYVYCMESSLASDVIFFTARKKDETTVGINWINNDESETSKYILEKSSDGRTFQYVEQFTAFSRENQPGNYQYNHHVAGERGKIIFRIKQIGKDGTIKYTPLRVVELSKNDVITHVYPNPSSGQVNIVFHNQKRSDYIVEIFCVNGQLIDRTSYKNALLARLNLQGRLKKGTYLLKVIEKRSEKQSVHKLIIR